MNRPALRRAFWGGVALAALILVADLFVMPLIVHSKGEVSVPSVVGETYDDAARALEAKGFGVRKNEIAVNDATRPGTVIAQNPYGGEVVKEGRRVYLTVSAGVEYGTIPSVTGKALRDARIDIENAGFKVATISYEHSNDAGDDAVLRQTPHPGARAPSGTEIFLAVSDGPEHPKINVPNLVGLTLAEAQQKIQLAGLTFGTISYRHNSSLLPSTVTEQAPAAGVQADALSPVNVTVVSE